MRALLCFSIIQDVLAAWHACAALYAVLVMACLPSQLAAHSLAAVYTW